MPVSKAKRKYDALRKAGFLPFEAIEFVRTSKTTKEGKIKVIPVPLNTPYIKEMIRARARAFRQAKREGVTIPDYITSIEDFYREEGFLTPEGLPDFWQYFRDVRDKAIEEGDYPSPPRRKPKLLDKGDVKAQRGRYRERRKTALERYDEGRGR